MKLDIIDSKFYSMNVKASHFYVLAFFISLLLLSSCSQDQTPLNRAPLSERKTQTVYVTKVIDGDSLMLRADGKNFEARLFGIDAPDYRYLQKIKILGMVA